MTERIQTQGIPITDDDATIAKALEDASIPTLLLSMVHMTGDTSILKGELRPQGVYLNEIQGFMPEEMQAQVREKALEVIKTFRDGGCKLPPPPSDDEIHEMMQFLVAGEVSREYVPFFLEELELDGVDVRKVEIEADVVKKQAFRVLVIGGGESGLLAAIRLEEAGIPYTVIEKNASVGGTWYENTYPGCRVDVGNHFYCYSFEPNNDWTEFFAQHSELRAYFENIMKKYGVEKNFRFETEVIAATWNEGDATWTVRVRSKNGREEELVARFVISAVGQLNRSKLPEISGIENFKGAWMHSAKWDHAVDLKGKRVAVIGTGASAFQIVPAIAEDVASLHVFQRSAPWMFSNPNYHAKVGEGKKWVLKHLPYYARWYRFLLFWPAVDALLPMLEIDPDWEKKEITLSAGHEVIHNIFTSYLKEQVGDDPELLEKVIPEYVCLGKRTLQDNGSWLQALKRDNVDLITTPIAEISGTGVRLEDGTTIDVDAIVYATGFDANRFLWPMEITGRGGVKLAEQWGEDPAAYLGITMPNFPNFCCMYGPGTNLAHGGSLIFHSECQIRYAMGAIKVLLERDAKSIECKQEVHDAYDEKLQKKIGTMIWSHPSIKNSWYCNDSGRVTVLSPWRLLDYWAWTKEPRLEDFEIT